MRIVSLVPSLTATLAELGLESSLVGCTSFCVDPPGLARRITVVGGTKDPDISKISLLMPDRILVNTEENLASDINACRGLAPVHESFPRSPDDVPGMIRAIGEFTGADAAAAHIAENTARALQSLKNAGIVKPRKSTFLYLIWRAPYMAAGRDTYISDFLEMAGFRNALKSLRYPELAMDAMVELNPEIIFFSSEPWPFRKRDYQAFAAQWRLVTGSRMPTLFKIDGKALSWHGAETQRTARSLQLWIEGAATTAPEIIRPALPDAD